MKYNMARLNDSTADGQVLPVLYLGDFTPYSVPWPTAAVTREISVSGSFAVR